MWLKDGNLGCDTCDAVHEYDGPRVLVLNAARSRGWHLFKGVSLTGKQLEKHICSDCIGTARMVKEKVDRFDQEEPLF